MSVAIPPNAATSEGDDSKQSNVYVEMAIQKLDLIALHLEKEADIGDVRRTKAEIKALLPLARTALRAVDELYGPKA